jgi:hypothetical protein
MDIVTLSRQRKCSCLRDVSPSAIFQCVEFNVQSPGTSTLLKPVPFSQLGFSTPPVIPYDGPPISSSRVLFPASLNLSATMMPAVPAPTTIASHSLVLQSLEHDCRLRTGEAEDMPLKAPMAAITCDVLILAVDNLQRFGTLSADKTEILRLGIECFLCP